MFGELLLLALFIAAVVIFRVVAAKNNAARTETFFLGTIHPRVMDQQTTDIYSDFLTRFRTAYNTMFAVSIMSPLDVEKSIAGLDTLEKTVEPVFGLFFKMTQENRELIDKNLSLMLAAYEQKYPEHSAESQELIGALRGLLARQPEPMSRVVDESQPYDSERFELAITHLKSKDKESAQMFNDFLTRFRTAFVMMHAVSNMITFGPEKALASLDGFKNTTEPIFARFINLNSEHHEIIEENLVAMLAACQQIHPEHGEANQKLVDALRAFLLKTEIKA